MSRRQWQDHVAKRPEIADALELTKAAMTTAVSVEPDRHRPVDEEGRYFASSASLVGVSGLVIASSSVSNMSDNVITDGQSSIRVAGMNERKTTYEDPGAWIRSRIR